MATLGKSIDVQHANSRLGEYPPQSRRFDIAVLLGGLWLIAGIIVDTYAHVNMPASLESFFTPWHLVLYTGFGAIAAVHVYTQYRNVQQGYAWTRALPKGYNLSLLGVGLFAFGGVFDMLWHEILGIEFDVEAAFSPSHLFIIAAAAILLTGPFRAMWTRERDQRGWRDLFPALISLFFGLILIMDVGQFLNGFVDPGNIIATGQTLSHGDTQLRDLAGITGVIIPVMLWMSLLLPMVLRWRLPFGAVTLLIGGVTLVVYGVRMSISDGYWHVAAAVLIASLVIDALLQTLQPSWERLGQFRLFAFLAPAILTGVYLASLLLTDGLRWRVHMWGGILFLAGIIALALSYLMTLPRNTES